MYRGIRNFAVLLGFFAGIWLMVRYFMPLLFPFLLGTALALAAEPMVRLLCRGLRIPRGAAAGIGVTAAFCFLTLLFLLVCALIVRELGILVQMLPNLEEAADSGLSRLSAWALGLIQRLPVGIRDILSRNASEFFSGSSQLLDQAFRYVVNLASGVLSHVPDSALILGTAILSSYMISAKLPRIKMWLSEKIPRNRLCKYLSAFQQVKTTLAGWFRAQFKLMGVTLLILTCGFLLLRIRYGPLWAAVVALVDALPVLGTGTVLLPWSLICFLEGETARAIGLLGIYVLVSLTRSVLEPKLLGHHLGLDPLATLAAMYAGYKIWGIGGMILAPMLAVVAVQLVRMPDAEK